jgi:hypothetical protein
MKFYCHLQQPKSIPCHEQCILCKRYEESLNGIKKDTVEIAFLAGRSKQSWEDFKKENNLK